MDKSLNQLEVSVIPTGNLVCDQEVPVTQRKGGGRNYGLRILW